MGTEKRLFLRSFLAAKFPVARAVVAVIAVVTLLSRSAGPILEAISWPFSRAKERYFGPLLIFSIPQ